MVWARLSPTLSPPTANRDADPAWQGSNDIKANRRIQARLGQRGRQEGLGMKEITKELYNKNSSISLMIQEQICLAKVDAIEEFFDAIFIDEKGEKTPDDKLDLEELLDWIYCLRDQMVGLYSELAEKHRGGQ